MLRIVELGWSTTVQDGGRPGRAALGVPRAGAVDRSALALANRLVGNAPGAPGLETVRGLVVEAVAPLVVATSADGVRHTLRRGDRLAVAGPIDGMWGYLAVRGGLAIAPVLGSCSHDTLSGLGPVPLTAGTDLPVGPEPATDLPVDLAPRRPRDRVARLWPGPHAAWFGGIEAMTDAAWIVQSDVSRVGARLSAGRFDRSAIAPRAAMSSFGLVEGAIQVTPSDEPIVMLANHPTTGGYPVIAVVDPGDVEVVAQAPPGVTVRFRSA